MTDAEIEELIRGHGGLLALLKTTLAAESGKLVPVPTHAVVELWADGMVKVFGPKHLRVKIVNRPHADSGRAEALVDTLVEESLPHSYRQVYWPSYSRGSGTYEALTVEELHWRQKRLDLDKALFDTLNRLTLRNRVG